jgi:hypothetical protein
MTDMKTLVILILLAATAVLGYLYYDSQRSSVKINLPGVKIEAK